MIRWIALAAATLALSACSTRSGEDREDGVFDQIGGVARQLFDRRADAPQGITLSDAQLNGAPVDVMILRIPDSGTEVGLVPQAVNRDVRTWITPEGYSVQIRNGQIVGTAGFGFDLASGTAPNIAQPRVVRDHYRLVEDGRTERTRFFCEIAQTPAQRVVVTGRAFATTLLSEACRTEDGLEIQNRYWVDGLGIVRQSHQFVSERLGYFDLQDVHTGLR